MQHVLAVLDTTTADPLGLLCPWRTPLRRFYNDFGGIGHDAETYKRYWSAGGIGPSLCAGEIEDWIEATAAIARRGGTLGGRRPGTTGNGVRVCVVCHDSFGEEGIELAKRLHGRGTEVYFLGFVATADTKFSVANREFVGVERVYHARLRDRMYGISGHGGERTPTGSRWRGHLSNTKTVGAPTRRLPAGLMASTPGYTRVASAIGGLVSARSRGGSMETDAGAFYRARDVEEMYRELLWEVKQRDMPIEETGGSATTSEHVPTDSTRVSVLSRANQVELGPVIDEPQEVTEDTEKSIVKVHITNKMVGFTRIKLHSGPEIRKNSALASKKVIVPVYQVILSNKCGARGVYFFTRYAERQKGTDLNGNIEDVTFDVVKETAVFEGFRKARWSTTYDVLEFRELDWRKKEVRDQHIEGMKSYKYKDREAIQMHALGASDGCLMCVLPSNITAMHEKLPKHTGSGSQGSFMRTIASMVEEDESAGYDVTIEVHIDRVNWFGSESLDRGRLQRYRDLIEYANRSEN